MAQGRCPAGPSHPDLVFPSSSRASEPPAAGTLPARDGQGLFDVQAARRRVATQVRLGRNARVLSLAFLAAGLLALAATTQAPAPGDADTGAVTVAVSENRLPQAGDDSLAVRSGLAATVDVLANDSDPDGDQLSVVAATAGAHGSVECAPAGSCTYTSVSGYAGSDVFTYTVEDGYGGADLGIVTVTVRPPEVPSLSIGDAEVTEGDLGLRYASFTVTLSAPSSEAVMVAYATVAGTATPGQDYTLARGALVFSPGGPLTETITVAVRGDLSFEADETFFVMLSNATGASVIDGWGVGKIVNDYDPPGSSKLLIGFTDDVVKWEPVKAAGMARDLGASSFGITLSWPAGRTALSRRDVSELDSAVSSGMRIVVSVFGSRPPLTASEREQYCGYVRDIIARYPQINDVGIWNEPNVSFFWQPQFNPDGSSAAPAAYEALLARCWDVLHTFRPGVNVVGGATSSRGNDRPSAGGRASHSPGNFIHELGVAYRLTGRTRPIFDTFGHHPYGVTSAERPWTQHPYSKTISEGDYAKLIQALYDAFYGTAQPIPGQEIEDRLPGGPTKTFSVWYLEMGFQTIPDARVRASYVGTETDRGVLEDRRSGASSSGSVESPDLAMQISAAVRLAYCQPYVEAFFNFKLWDEQDLGRWQSGPLWADRTRKDSYWAFRRVIAEANAGGIDCSQFERPPSPISFEPEVDVAVETIEWPLPRISASFRPARSLRIKTAEDARYIATLYRLGKAGTDGPRRRTAVLVSTGDLDGGRLRVVRFPKRVVDPGAYQIEIVLTSSANPARTTALASQTIVIATRIGSR